MDLDPGNLIFFLFVAVSAAASWLQKRREKAREVSWDEVKGPQGGGDGKPPKPETEKGGGFNLEEEFKRMVRELSGEPEAPMARPVPPPPVPKPPPTPRPVFDSDAEGDSAVPASVSEASGFIRSGMSLKDARREADRIRRGAKKVKTRNVRSGRARPVGTTSIIRNLRSPRSAREAVLASVVLGSPKAFE